MDTVCYEKWVQDTNSCQSQIVTGSSSILESNYLRSREDSTSERGSGIHFGQSCHRTSHFIPSEEWLLQPAVSGSQEVVRMETSNRSLPTESAYYHPSLQNGNFGLSSSCSMEERLGHFSGLEGYILSHPYSSQVKEISSIPFYRENIPVSSLAVRALTPAPYAFSRLVKGVIKHCRHMEMCLHAYLNDWLPRSRVISLYQGE